MESPATEWNPYPQPGEVLDGKYRIERMLGEGGMGAVVKATHVLRRAPVALKFMSGAMLSLPGAVERFVNEGVAASQIDSDHVVRIFDVGRMPNGAPYLVMEFLDGRDLGHLVEVEGPTLASPRAVHFCLQMLRALHVAHHVGVVHRDMKPSNCFVIRKDGEPDFLKLVDFGISKVRSEEGASGQLTRTNTALGTPLYMSPEQARSPRDVDSRSDLYSVGAILYELLCGRTPYTSDTGEYTDLLFKIFTTEPAPLRALSPSVPDALAATVHRALARDREARFQSAVEMGEALAAFADARSTEAVARLLGTRSRSLVPAGLAGGLGATATAPEAAAPRAGATLDLLPGIPLPIEVDAAKLVLPTHMDLIGSQSGLTAAHTTSRRPARAVVMGFIVAGALALAGLFFFALQTRVPHASAVTASPVAAPPEVALNAVESSAAIPPLGPLDEASVPVPDPRASLDAAPPVARARPKSAATGAQSVSPPSGLPKDLGDLKLH